MPRLFINRITAKPGRDMDPPDESVFFIGDARIVLLHASGRGQVRVCIEAPPDVFVSRPDARRKEAKR